MATKTVPIGSFESWVKMPVASSSRKISKLPSAFWPVRSAEEGKATQAPLAAIRGGRVEPVADAVKAVMVAGPRSARKSSWLPSGLLPSKLAWEANRMRVPSGVAAE
jgi:hypothetical protein